MAQIALGIGTSHAPQLGTPPDQWGQRAQADRANPALVFRGEEYTFDELNELRGAGVRGRVRARALGQAARREPRRDRRARESSSRRPSWTSS